MPEPAGEFFGARAKVLLDIEMDSPNVATVQALVILSAVEAAYTRDARGWLYSGKQYTGSIVDCWSTDRVQRHGRKAECRPWAPS